MRRSFVMSTLACALALAPAVVFAQAAPAAPAQPAALKVSFAAPAGLLLVQIKPDQTAVFEEMMGKLQAGLAKTADAKLKEQAAGIKVYKSTEPFGPNPLYVILVEPTIAASEYDLFDLLNRTMTDDEKRAAAESKMWDKYAAVFANALGRLNLTPLAK
jgi:hypothetical protein